MAYRMEQLGRQDVVCIPDGNRIGRVSDLELDPKNGRITALVVTLQGDWRSLFRPQGECVVPWEQVECIGGDTILIRCHPTPRNPTAKHGFF